MPFFKNANFVKRNFKSTDIVFCEAETAPDSSWIECQAIEVELLNCYQLYKQNEVRYFGWL